MSTKGPKAEILAAEARARAAELREQGLPKILVDSQMAIAESIDANARAFEPAELRLLFTGQPVAGDEGVSAGFLGEMLQNLSKAIKVQFDIQGDHADFVVAGTATGSFGVVLRDLPAQQALLDDGDSRLLRSARTVARSLGVIASGDEQEIDEQLGSSSSLRGALKNLLAVAAQNDAGIKLEGTVLPLGSWIIMDAVDVRRAARLLDTIVESEATEELDGIPEGFLPNARLVEIRRTRKARNPMTTDVDPDVDGDALHEARNLWCRLTFRKRIIEYPSGYTRTKRTLVGFRILPLQVQTDLDIKSDAEEDPDSADG